MFYILFLFQKIPHDDLSLAVTSIANLVSSTFFHWLINYILNTVHTYIVISCPFTQQDNRSELLGKMNTIQAKTNTTVNIHFVINVLFSNFRK